MFKLPHICTQSTIKIKHLTERLADGQLPTTEYYCTTENRIVEHCPKPKLSVPDEIVQFQNLNSFLEYDVI